MTIWIAPNCPAEIDHIIRRQAAERGEQVMPSRPFPWNRVSSKRQTLPKNRQGCPSSVSLPLNLPRESADRRTVAERKWQAAKRCDIPQKSCDIGLFSDDRDQLEMPIK